jgi:hypothetical protein
MRQLTWPCKRFTSVRPIIKMLTNFMPLILLVVIPNCRFQVDNEIAAKDPWSFNPFQSLNDKFDKEQDRQFIPVYSAKSEKSVLFEIEDSACRAVTKSHETNFRIRLKSFFGTHLAKVKTSTLSLRVEAEVEGQKLFFITSGNPKEFIGAVCETVLLDPDSAAELNLPQKKIDHDFQIVVFEWLSHIAPACEIEVNAENGFDCQLARTDPIHAQRQLMGVQSTMIRRWSRQPYLLSRRLAIAFQLSQILQKPRLTDELKSFCQIIATSLPEELPLALRPQRVRNVLCDEDSKNREQAALFALAGAVEEIEFLRIISEKTSRLGYLKVSVPRADIPSKNIWVSIKPDVDVAKHIGEQAANLWSKNETTNTDDDSQENEDLTMLPKACWHPAFSESSAILQLARHLNLSGDDPEVICADSPASQDHAIYQPERYFSDSITSETEFIVSNGRAKMLRLPKGQYVYSLQSLPLDPQNWDDVSAGEPQSQGTISWTKRRPYPVIKSW